MIRFEVQVTTLQLTAIAQQAAVYGTDETPDCKGLSDVRVHRWDDDPDFGDGYPAGSVMADFSYITDDDGAGLETTVFGPDGTVLDSQDWG